MGRLHPVALSMTLALVLCTAAAAQSSPRKYVAPPNSLQDFTPIEYLYGITLSDQQWAVFDKLQAQETENRNTAFAPVVTARQDSVRFSSKAVRDSVSQLFAVTRDSMNRRTLALRDSALTPAQRQVVANHREVLTLFKAKHVRFGNMLVRMFLGLRLTDQQLAAFHQYLETSPGKFRAALEAAGLKPNSATKTNNPVNYHQGGVQLRELYAMLTPEQQALAAPDYEQTQAYFECVSQSQGAAQRSCGVQAAPSRAS